MPQPKPSFSSATFGRRLVSRRRAAGFTQQQLADKSGISRRMIAHYETQAAVPPGDVLSKLAEVLGVSTDELLGRRRQTLDPQQVPQSTLEVRLWRKLRKIQKLPPSTRRAVLKVIDNFLAAEGVDDGAA